MQHEQHKQQKQAYFWKFGKFLREHAIANSYTYYELIGELSNENDANVHSLLVKLLFTTVCQLLNHRIKSARRHDNEDRKPVAPQFKTRSTERNDDEDRK